MEIGLPFPVNKRPREHGHVPGTPGVVGLRPRNGERPPHSLEFGHLDVVEGVLRRRVAGSKAHSYSQEQQHDPFLHGLLLPKRGRPLTHDVIGYSTSGQALL